MRDFGSAARASKVHPVRKISVNHHAAWYDVCLTRDRLIRHSTAIRATRSSKLSHHLPFLRLYQVRLDIPSRSHGLVAVIHPHAPSLGAFAYTPACTLADTPPGRTRSHKASQAPSAQTTSSDPLKRKSIRNRSPKHSGQIAFAQMALPSSAPLHSDTPSLPVSMDASSCKEDNPKIQCS
jgi:hypothetical protein